MGDINWSFCGLVVRQFWRFGGLVVWWFGGLDGLVASAVR